MKCQCDRQGCDKEVMTPGGRYAIGHSPHSRVVVKCQCSPECKEDSRPGDMYAYGHKKLTNVPRRCQCEPGCACIVTSFGALYARGHHPNSGVMTESTKIKLSKAQLSVWSNPEYREKMARVQRMVAKRPDVRERLLRWNKENWNDPEYRKIMADASRRNWNTPEFVVSMKQFHKIRAGTDKARKAFSDRSKKQWLNLEYKQKMSQLQKNLWGDPEYVKRMAKSRESYYDSKIGVCPKRRMFKYEGKQGIRMMRSKWEVAFAKWLDDGNIDWQYELTSYWVGNEGWKGKTYKPDFYLPARIDMRRLKVIFLRGTIGSMKDFVKCILRLPVKLGCSVWRNWRRQVLLFGRVKVADGLCMILVALIGN